MPHTLRYARFWGLAAPLAALGILLGIVAARPQAALAQLAPWPTPPPGPVGFIPEVIPSSLMTPVAAPSTPGGIALQVDPLFAGPVPRDPPRPAVIVESGESNPQARVTLEFVSGALVRTVQLTYQPVAVGLAPAPVAGQRVLRAFQVTLYDAKGAAVTPTFRIPVPMSLHPSAAEKAAAGGDESRLLIARYDPDAKRWLPLLTRYDSARNTLYTPIMQPGLFAVIAIPAPVQ
ncbi:MAG: hypothetical protein HY681_08215 [Chloroflexi bacterium]|nr:hypothetical protein [Chloroflexota bacterium]